MFYCQIQTKVFMCTKITFLFLSQNNLLNCTRLSVKFEKGKEVSIKHKTKSNYKVRSKTGEDE